MRLQNGSRRRIFISSSSDPDGNVNGSRRRQVCAYVWLGDQFPMGTTYSLFNTRDGRTSPSSKTHHTGLWNVLLSRPVGASQQLQVERKSYMSFYLRYMQICSNRCYVFLCFLFGFVCCFFLPVQINTLLQVWKDKKSHTAFLPPETLGNAPHCGPTSWPSLAEVWLVFCWTAAVGVLDAFFIRGWGRRGMLLLSIIF